MFLIFSNDLSRRRGPGRGVGATILIAIFLIAGCAPTWQPIELNLYYEPSEDISEIEAVQAPRPGRIAFTSFVDDRSNKDTIGTTNVPVLGNDILPWLESGFRSLDSYGHQVDTPLLVERADFPGIALEVTLIKLYCSSHISTMRSAVICVVTFSQGEEVLGRRTYRGEYVKEKSLFGNANYKFSESTLMYGLNFGLTSVVDQVEQDLREFLERG